MKSKKQFKNLLTDITIKNKNGYTLNLDLKPTKYKKGFYVGLTDNSNKNINKAIDNLLKIKEKRFKNINKGLLIGGWIDEKTKKFYLDFSIFIKSKKIAVLIAKLFNQKAVFDIKNLNSIYI